MDVRCSIADPVADAGANVLGLLNLLPTTSARVSRRRRRRARNPPCTRATRGDPTKRP